MFAHCFSKGETARSFGGLGMTKKVCVFKRPTKMNVILRPPKDLVFKAGC
jgi:hypothetical protein